TDPQIGLKLSQIFREAGLPAPQMILHGRVEHGPDSPLYDLVAQNTRAMLPLMQRAGPALRTSAWTPWRSGCARKRRRWTRRWSLHDGWVRGRESRFDQPVRRGCDPMSHPRPLWSRPEERAHPVHPVYLHRGQEGLELARPRGRVPSGEGGGIPP